MSTAMDSPRRHRYTVDAYYRMAEAAILGPDERVELIDGEIIDVRHPEACTPAPSTTSRKYCGQQLAHLCSI